jgi:uncharacterized protein YbjQ (UPF0145 family)
LNEKMNTIEIKILTTTANELSGYQITRQLGIVHGVVVRSPNIAQGFVGGLKMLLGRRYQAYAKVCKKAREEALNALIQKAVECGANALVAVRYDATEFLPGATEVIAYGTAVIVQPNI